MQTWVDGLIVSAIAIATAVLVGWLGYLVDKNAEDTSGEPAGHKASEKARTAERGSSF